MNGERRRVPRERKKKTERREVPNLDALPRSELVEFAVRYRGGENAMELFGVDGKRARFLTDALSRYAYYAESAQDAREGGDVRGALAQEKICDEIYARLPDAARW